MQARCDPDMYGVDHKIQCYTLISLSEGSLISLVVGTFSDMLVFCFSSAIFPAWKKRAGLCGRGLGVCVIEELLLGRRRERLRLVLRFCSASMAISVILRIFLAALCLRQARCNVFAATSSFFRRMVDVRTRCWTLVGNSSLNFSSMVCFNWMNSSVSSTAPSTCLTRATRISKQCNRSPSYIARSNATRAISLGLAIPRGWSKSATKSDSCSYLMNWVAWGSYLSHTT